VEKRRFGRTGLDVSLLGFGCGAVGGLMIKGEAADQERAVARALELGINYFDTAQMYGNGQSEINLGKVLKALKPDCYVGTKVRLPPTERGRIGDAIAAALDASLKRLQRDSVDLYQFHNAIVDTTTGANFSAETVLDEVVPALQALEGQGKTRFYGITALGDTAAFKRALEDASAVVHNKASSGIYSAKLLEKLGLKEKLGSKIVVVDTGAAIMEYVAAQPPGAIGLAQISEVMVLIDKGCAVRLAAPLPDEIQNVTSYDAAATAASPSRDAARELAANLTSDAAKKIFAATGIS